MPIKVSQNHVLNSRIILIGLFFGLTIVSTIGSVPAELINSFNDSATEKNLTFDITIGSTQLTHIRIPKNATLGYYEYITLNLSSRENAIVDGFNISVFDTTSTTNPSGVDFNGTHYFIVSGNETVYRFNSTGQFDGFSFDVSTEVAFSTGLDFNGTHFLISDRTNDRIYVYDIDGNYGNFNFSVAGEDGVPIDVASNGTNIFMIGNDNDAVFMYDTSGAYTGFTFSVATEDTFPRGLNYLNGSFYMCGSINDSIYRYNSQGVHDGFSFNVSSQEDQCNDVAFNGTHFIIAGQTEDHIFRYLHVDIVNNVTIDTGNDQTIDYNFTGTLNVTNSPQTAGLNSTAAVNFLRSCTADSDGFCDLPLNISVAANGTMLISDINITYNFNNSFVLCGTISNTTAINFTTFQEENNTVPVRSDWEAEFDLSHADLSFLQNITFDPTNSTNLTVCIYPEDAEYITSATLKYTNNPSEAINYSTRYYFMQNAVIDNVTDDLFLYLLDLDISNQISIIVKNIYNLPQADIVVKATRFFISEDVYRQVDMGLSDFDGIATMQLKINEWYIIILEQNGLIIRSFPQKFIINANDIETFTTTGSEVEYYEYFDSVGASCTENPTTLLLTCIFSDTSGRMVNLNLTIEKRQLVGGFIGICTNTTTASSGTVSCSYSGYNDTELHYVLTGTFCCSQTTFWTIVMGNILPSASVLFGLTGVVVMIFIVITLVMFGYWNPVVPIVGGVFAMLIGVTLQLIAVPAVALGSLAVAGGIIIYKMKS